MKSFWIVLLVGMLLFAGCAGQAPSPSKEAEKKEQTETKAGQKTERSAEPTKSRTEEEEAERKQPEPAKKEEQQPEKKEEKPRELPEKQERREVEPSKPDARKPIDKLLELMKKPAAGWKAEYESTTQNPVIGKETKKIMLYIKGPEKQRIDTKDEPMEGRFYMLGNEIHACVKIEGFGFDCIKMPAQEKAATPTSPIEFASELEKNVMKYEVSALPPRNIAGAETFCFEAKSEELKKIMQYCYSKEGVLLYTRASGGEVETEITALKYWLEVSEEDFTIPAKEKELPEIGKLPIVPPTGG
ncbi:MAG: hypothetical protein N3G80_01555 [Candidatus Micrarchaeota archaeon]|nr:hypothetical protein [Candidatus Micrarchaeota archaeon]